MGFGVGERERAAPGAAEHEPAVNGDMGAPELRRYCKLDGAGERLLRLAVNRLGLSARAYHRVLKVARTIADLDDSEAVGWTHVAEALRYRPMDTRTDQEAIPSRLYATTVSP